MTDLTTWTQANAVIRRHFELFERLPTFPAEAADELTDALTGTITAAQAEAWDRAKAHILELVGFPDSGWVNPYRVLEETP